MARLYGMGFEMNSVTDGVEWTSVTGAGCTVGTSIVRSGTYAGRATSLASATRQGFLANTVASANKAGPLYSRFALYVATLPSAENLVAAGVDGTAISSAISWGITLDNTGALRLYNAAVQVGSASTPLITGRWYVVETWMDQSLAGGSQVMKARVDGATEFASASNLTITNGMQSIVVGANLNAESQTAGDWYFDDVCVNDSSAGGTQTTYPGLGKIAAAFPDAAGDNAAWTKTGGAATNWQSVNENPPDDVTTYVSTNTTSIIDDHQISCPAAIGTSDTVVCIGVLQRISAAAGGSNSAIRLRIKSAASGTVANGTAVTPTTTTWLTNTLTRVSWRYVSYTDPTTAVAWTPRGTNSVDNAQLGYDVSSANTNAVRISTIAGMIEYLPAVFGRATTVGQAVNRAGTY